MIEDFSPPDSPDDQNTNDPQQTDSDIPPQTSTEAGWAFMTLLGNSV